MTRKGNMERMNESHNYDMASAGKEGVGVKRFRIGKIRYTITTSL